MKHFIHHTRPVRASGSPRKSGITGFFTLCVLCASAVIFLLPASSHAAAEKESGFIDAAMRERIPGHEDLLLPVREYQIRQ